MACHPLTINLLRDLRRQGVRISLGPEGRLVARGYLGRLEPDHRAALSERSAELEVLARWETLQDESEVRFACPEARLYPFLRLDLLNAPVIRTELGDARLVRVVCGGCDVVLEAELDAWREATQVQKTLPLPSMKRLGLHQVFPPSKPPEAYR